MPARRRRARRVAAVAELRCELPVRRVECSGNNGRDPPEARRTTAATCPKLAARLRDAPEARIAAKTPRRSSQGNRRVLASARRATAAFWPLLAGQPSRHARSSRSNRRAMPEARGATVAAGLLGRPRLRQGRARGPQCSTLSALSTASFALIFPSITATSAASYTSFTSTASRMALRTNLGSRCIPLKSTAILRRTSPLS